MDRKTMISNYIDNVYKELDEKKEQPAVPAGGGLAAKPVKPVVEEDDTEERQGIVSRVGNMLSSYFKSDDDDTTIAMTTSPVTLDNAAKQAALNDLSIVDIIKANRDTPKDSGLINIPRKAPKKPEVRINVQEILSRLVPPTLPDAPTPTPSAPGGEAPSDGKVDKGLMSRPYDKEAMLDINEPEGEGNTIISGFNKDISENNLFSNDALKDAINTLTKNSTFNATVLGMINKEIGVGGTPRVEGGYGNLTGAEAAEDSRTRGGKGAESVARRVALRALDSNPNFVPGNKSKMIFDVMYDDQYRETDLKLGNTQVGDGSLFKGRGLIQVTGRENYKNVQDKLAEKGIQVDLMTNPELINDNKYALPAALAFLELKGITTDTIGELGPHKLTRVMNPGDKKGTKDRWSHVTSLLTGEDLIKAQNSDEKVAQKKAGVTDVDGIIGSNSIRAFEIYLEGNNVTIPEDATPYDLVRLVNAN